MTERDVHLFLDDSRLIIVPSFDELENKLLTFKEKKMVKQNHPPFKTVTQRNNVPFFTTISQDEVNQVKIIATWQGIWRKVVDFLNKSNRVYRFHDRRLPFPEPRYDLMFGFRFRQKELLETALQRGCSGLVVAPTRYGKTILIIDTLRAFPDVPTVVTVPGEDLYKQLYEDIKAALPNRNVTLMGKGTRKRFPGEDITVCSMDSLHKCDHGAVRLVLIDEPHSVVTDSRWPELAKFNKARILGFGATVTGRYDQRDILIESMIGPVLAERTFQEAVAEGAICPIRAYIIKIKFQPFPCGSRDVALKFMVTESERLASLVRWITHKLLPPEWQTLMFVKNEKSALHFLNHIGEDGTIAMAKRMSDAERKEKTAAMRSGSIKRCLASDIYAQGVTFSDLRAVINLASGGPYTGTVQKPGRLAEIRPSLNKRCGAMFDFIFEPVGPDAKRRGNWSGIMGEAFSRVRVYNSKGYDIKYFDDTDLTALAEDFREHCL